MVSIKVQILTLLDSMLTEDYDDNPLAYALVFFALRASQTTSINLNSLSSWAKEFVKDKYNTGKFTKAKNVEITALFLIYKTFMQVDKGSLPKGINNFLLRIYEKEYSEHNLFFKNLSYSALIQFSIYPIRKHIKKYQENTNNIINKYLHQEHFNNCLGLSFLTKVTEDKKLEEKIKLVFEKTSNYEYKVYLGYALWNQIKDKMTTSEILTIREQLDNLYIPFLADTINQGDISNFSKEKLHQITKKISPLYLAVSLLFISEFEKKGKKLQEKSIHQKYSNNGLFNRLFGFIFGPTLIISGLFFSYSAINTFLQNAFLLNFLEIIIFIFGTFLIYPIGYVLLIDLGIKKSADYLIVQALIKGCKTWFFSFLIGVVIYLIVIAIFVSHIQSFPLNKSTQSTTHNHINIYKH